MRDEGPLPANDLEARVAAGVHAIRARSDLEPRVGLTLGSGLGGAIAALDHPRVFTAAELPHWPPSTVAGHAGRLVLGLWHGVPVAALAGRSHRYEGLSLDRVTFGARVMRSLGAGTMIFTHAVGAIHPDLAPGDLVAVTDHLNFIGKRGLFTRSELSVRRAGRRLGAVYDPGLRSRLIEAAAEAGVRLRPGVLFGTHGPSYETAAEVRMASALGADVVCMSTVHEALVAAELGGVCAALSCVTNRATGLSTERLTHQQVTEVADRAASRLAAVLDRFLWIESRSGA